MDKAIDIILNYIKINEKEEDNLNLGPEFEHIIVDRKTYESISYYGEKGIEFIFKSLVDLGWEPSYEGDHVLGLSKEEMYITTEPGGQVEFNSVQKKTIKELEDMYREFFCDILPILDDLNYDILAVGYHPKTKIEDIKLLPKKRYDAMYEHFKTHGSMSHNMMKGTAGLQLSLDYTSEEDFRKKFVVANGITNAFYALFDNGYFFEGEPTIHNIRAKIWENTDPERSGLAKNSFIDDSYLGYSKYVAETTAIFGYVNGELVPTGDKKIGELIDENSSKEEIEHLLTMVFPDIRVKKFIELRMMDAVPYPYNFSAYAILKGLIYNEENLNTLYNRFKDLTPEDLNKVRREMYEKGNETIFLDKTLKEWNLEFIEMADRVLGDERKYLEPIKKLINEEGSFYNKSERIYKETKDIKKAVEFNKIKMEDLCTQVK